MTDQSTNSYSVGHPWYYVLGGAVQYPKAILADVKTSGYRGWQANKIDAADKLPEPQRSETLRQIKSETLRGFRSELTQYRCAARELSHYRKTVETGGNEVAHAAIHTKVTNIYGHLFNDLAHLICLDEFLTQQRDFFD